MGVPLYVICHFSLAAFHNFSLSLIFADLITMCLGVFLLGFILYGTLRFLDLGGYFHSHVREVFDYNLFKYFLWSFLSPPSGTPIMRMLLHLMLSQRSLRLSSFLFILFSLFYSTTVNSTILSFRLLIRSSASVILLLVPSSVVFVSVIVLFMTV